MKRTPFHIQGEEKKGRYDGSQLIRKKKRERAMVEFWEIAKGNEAKERKKETRKGQRLLVQI